MRNIAIITARGGSVTLPNKNILDLNGKPLIAWTIEAALGAKFIDRLILSSDSDKIIKIAKEFSCDVPFVRPADLSDSKAKSADVIAHALNSLDEKYEYFTLLQPTSPLRTSQDIDNAFDLMLLKNASSCVSVCKAQENPFYMQLLNKDGTLKTLIETRATRRQDMPEAYLLNGAIYIKKVEEFLKDRLFTDKKTIAYIMPEERSADIDTLADFEKVKELMRSNDKK